MKKYFKIIAILIVSLFGQINVQAQITINNTLYTPTQLVDGVLVPLTSGTVISNVSFGGVYNNTSRYQVGYFSTASTTLAQMGFTSGVVLTSGNTSTIPMTLGADPGATQMATAYSSCTAGELRQGGTCPAGNNDLDVLAGAQNYFNAAVLEFDFVPVQNAVTFRYVFGSEEYNDSSNSAFDINYNCSSYNDKFGFLISGPGIAGGQGFTNNARNIARLSNGSEVSINSVNDGVVGSSASPQNASYCTLANGAWVQNTPTPEFLGPIDGTQLNGNTRILTATQSGLVPGQTYHIKLIVTDVNDATYDSVVYLEAGSFTTESTCNAGPDQGLCGTTSTTLAATSPLTGSWSVQSGTAIFSNSTSPTSSVSGLSLGANVLRWTATDLSCFADVTITVSTVPAVPTVTTAAATCSANGTATVSNYSAALTYTSTPAGLTVGAGGLVTGFTCGTPYTITATNAATCFATSASFTVQCQLAAPVVPTVATIAATCFANGTATVSNYSAALSYTSTPVGLTVGAGGVVTGFTCGTPYTITATNAATCFATSTSFTVQCQLAAPAAPTVATIAATCLANGTATVSNYSAALTYTSTPVGLTVGAGGLVTGFTCGTPYTITATNAATCFATSASFTIQCQLAAPAAPTVATAAATCLANGTATVSNYSAALTYTSTPAGLTVGAGGVVTGFTCGTPYTITATNAATCFATSASFTVQCQLAAPAAPTVATLAATCFANGTATVSNYSAALTYTSTPAGLTVGVGGLVTGFTCGTPYTITATNAATCFATSASFTVQCQLAAPAVPTVATIAATCFANGTATVSNYSAALTYTSTPAGLTVGAGGVVTGFTCGTPYTITATNAATCFATSASFTVQCQLAAPAVPTVATIAATCFANGTATVSNYSAALTYTSTPAGLTVGSGGVVSGFTCGTPYTVTATNAATCFATSASFTVQCQLAAPVVPTVATTAATCFANGTATVSNYSAGLTYTSLPAGLSVGAGGVVTGFTCGIPYTITATNAATCTATSASFTVQCQLAAPAVPTVATAAATCLANGTAIVSNYSAALTYTSSPAGLSVGAGGVVSGFICGIPYTITATNAATCFATSVNFTVQCQLAAPAVPTVATAVPTCSASGSSTITNYSASNTYVFTPPGPTVGAGGLISGMTVGIGYIVTATNGGCASGASVSFSNAAQLPPSLPLITMTAATCSASGSSIISNYSALDSYAFTPSGPTVGAGGVISGMTVGTSYTVTATNGACVSLASSTFSNAAQLATPLVPIITTAVPTCSASGSTIITNYNASNTYVFLPSGPTVGAGGVLSGMTVGVSYTVTATNGGCTSSASVSFSNAAQLPTPNVSVVSGCVDLDYVLQANIITNASYQWFDSSGNLLGTQSSVVVTISGMYEVRVDLNGCLVSEFVNVDNAFCSIPKGVSPNNDNANDFWDLSNLNVQKAQIFNRYGTEVYSKLNYLNEWNGNSDRGQELPSATYYYVLTFANGKVKTGWVYLTREN
jgi:gliding motility-associated-like protein